MNGPNRSYGFATNIFLGNFFLMSFLIGSQTSLKSFIDIFFLVFSKPYLFSIFRHGSNELFLMLSKLRLNQINSLSVRVIHSSIFTLTLWLLPVPREVIIILV